MEKKKEGTKPLFKYLRLPLGGASFALYGESRVGASSSANISHFHNLMEIGCCFEGYGRVLIEGEELPYEQDFFFMIPANIPHEIISDDPHGSHWKYFYIDPAGFLSEIYESGGGENSPAGASSGRASARRLSRMTEALIKYPVTGSAQAFEGDPELMMLEGVDEDEVRIGDLIREILDILCSLNEDRSDADFERDILYAREEARALTLTLLVKAARKNMKKAGGAYAPGKGRVPLSSLPETVEWAIDYIEENFAERLSVKDIADELHISEGHFRRLFTRHVGMSPLDFITETRIRSACSLLAKDAFDIPAIAAMCGFATLSTFNRSFRRVTETSPDKWRRENSGA